MLVICELLKIHHERIGAQRRLNIFVHNVSQFYFVTPRMSHDILNPVHTPDSIVRVFAKQKS